MFEVCSETQLNRSAKPNIAYPVSMLHAVFMVCRDVHAQYYLVIRFDLSS